jgi:hypothetical protein
MPGDLFLELLLKHSAARLRELYAEADEKVRQGELERGYISRALQVKGGDATQPARVDAPPRKTSAKPGAAREPIIEIAQSDAEHVWLPSEMRNLLQDRYGLDIPTGTIRAAMKRLLEEKVLARPTDSPNGFKLASRNGSSAESNAGPTENGATEPLLPATGPHKGDQQ